MGCHRRGKPVLHGFRSLVSRVALQNPKFQPSLRIYHSGYFDSGSKAATFNGFSSFCSISQKNNLYNPFLSGARRFYFLDSGSKGATFNGFSSFCSISYRLGKRGVVGGVNRNIDNFLLSVGARRFYSVKSGFKGGNISFWSSIFLAVTLSGCVIAYFMHLETVPFTKRTHLVLLPKDVERWIGEEMFEDIKANYYKKKILPPMHPESLRVRMIARNIIDAYALQRGLRKDKKLVWSENKVEGKEDDKLVQQSAFILHLDGLNWEVLVVNSPVVKVFNVAGGKIFVFAGVLEHFKSDAEIATMIGHEVGHVVARHSAEKWLKFWLFSILERIVGLFVSPDNVKNMSSSYLWLPLSRRLEMEADYIGLILMASAGYDPRVAPGVYEKLGEVHNDSTLEEHLLTHPLGRERAELLAHPKIMEKAITIYSSITERGV